MMMQAPDAALLREMRMCGMSSEHLVQGRRSRIDIAIVEIPAHTPYGLGERKERRTGSMSELRDRRRIDGKDAREGGSGFTYRRGDFTLVSGVKFVDERLRHKQAGISVTV